MQNNLKQYKYTRVQTPVGEAIYPHLNKPDTKYNAEGVFKVKLKLAPTQERDDLISIINAEEEKHYNAACEEAKKAGKRPPKRSEINYYIDDEGYGYLSVKCNATINNREKGEVVQKTLPILSMDGSKFDTIRYVNSGAEIAVVLDLVPMNSAIAGAGVSLRLICVKVHKFAALPARQETTESAQDAF